MSLPLTTAIQAITDIGEVVWIREMHHISVASSDKPSQYFARRIDVLHSAAGYRVLQDDSVTTILLHCMTNQDCRSVCEEVIASLS